MRFITNGFRRFDKALPALIWILACCASVSAQTIIPPDYSILPPSANGCQAPRTDPNGQPWKVCTTAELQAAFLRTNNDTFTCPPTFPNGKHGYGFEGITFAHIGDKWPVDGTAQATVTADELAKVMTGATKTCRMGTPVFTEATCTPGTDPTCFWCSDTIMLVGPARKTGSDLAFGFVGGFNTGRLAPYFTPANDPSYTGQWVVIGTGDIENMLTKCSGRIVCPVEDPYGFMAPNPNTDSLISTAFSTVSTVGTSQFTCDPRLESSVPQYAYTDSGALQFVGYATSWDTGALEFDFVSKHNLIQFDFSFASDEYPEYVNVGYNDVFALYLNGKNIALLPDNKTVVSVDNVNNGNDVLGGSYDVARNPQFFLDNRNTGKVGTSPLPLEVDGLTLLPPPNPDPTVPVSLSNPRRPLTAQGPALTGGLLNTVRFAITDIGDSLADSFVLLRIPSLKSTPIIRNPDADTSVCKDPANPSALIPCVAATPPICPTFEGRNFQVASLNNAAVKSVVTRLAIDATNVYLDYSDATNGIKILINSPSSYTADNSGYSGPGVTVYALCDLTNTGSTVPVGDGRYTCKLTVGDNGDSGTANPLLGTPADTFTLWVNTGSPIPTYTSGNPALVSGNIRSCMTGSCPASSGIVGTSYKSATQAQYGFPPYNYQVVGSLPPGLLLNSTTGAITGVPQVADTYLFSIQAVDSGVPSQAVTSAGCSITVGKLACSTPVAGNVAFNSAPIAYNSGNNFIWFNSNIAVTGLGNTEATLLFENSSIILTDSKGNTVATIPVPDSIVTFSPVPPSLDNCSFAAFDDTSQTWNVGVPMAGSGEVFLTGIPYPVPKAGLPGGLKASWRGIFRTNSPGISIQFRWGAAVYNRFSAYPGSLGVKPTLIPGCPPHSTSSHAGTPELYAYSGLVIPGGTGDGTSFTGSWPGAQNVKFCPTNIPFTTYTQGGWGAAPRGNNPGALLKDNFSTVYSLGSVSIGQTFSLAFTSASAIENFLPQGGTAGVLKGNAVNPTSSAGGVLGGQLLALQLNVDFSNNGFTRGGLADLYLTSGPLAGRTVSQVLVLANAVFGGSLSALPPGVSVSNLNDVLTSINENYDGGTTDKKYLSTTPPANPPSPSPSNDHGAKHQANPHGMDDRDAHGARGLATGSTKVVRPGLSYDGSPLIATPTIYYIWYGGWGQKPGSDSAEGQNILRDFARRIGGSAHFALNSSYATPAYPITGMVKFGGETTDAYSRGKTLSDADVRVIVESAIKSNRLPYDANGVYFVLSSSDVAESSGFCSQYCGWRTSGTLNGSPLRYSFVGNPQNCLNVCAPQSKGPNGNAAVDAMVSIIDQELDGAVVSPDSKSGWLDVFGKTSVDRCSWTFGHDQYQTKNGAWANIRLGDRDFLVQRNLQHTSKGDVCKVDPKRD